MAGSKKLLNYTTQISLEKTTSEIIALLAQHKAQGIELDYAGTGTIQAISFSVMVGNREIPFRMPADVEATRLVLAAQRKEGLVPAAALRPGQPERIAWRILKDWLEAQLALIQTGQARLEQVMMPYIILRDGRSLFHYMLEEGFQRMLPEARSA